MFKDKKFMILVIAIVVIFGVTFGLGIFANPHFDIYDFCMSLATEFIGLIIALVVVIGYLGYEKRKKGSSESDKNNAK